jgi:hypothetical protein
MKEDVILASIGVILAIIAGWFLLTSRKGRK